MWMRCLKKCSVALLIVHLAGCSSSDRRHVSGHEPIVGGPCEGCEAVFQGRPDEPQTAARLAPDDQPGEPLRIVGTVRHADGSAAPGTIVYAYHTNIEGVYPKDERLRGWAEADEDGRYQFDTIRPGGYPDSDMPAHIHMHVIEPGRCTYYIDDIVFTHDPRLTAEKREQHTHGRGGSGLTTPKRNDEGVWIVERDIVLGKGIPGYVPRKP